MCTYGPLLPGEIRPEFRPETGFGAKFARNFAPRKKTEIRPISGRNFGGRNGKSAFRPEISFPERHPQSRAPIRADYISDPTIDRITIDEAALVQVLRKLDTHVAPGPGGWNNAMLRALSFTDSFASPVAQKVVTSLKMYGELFVNNDLPAWYNWLATAVREVGLTKPGPGAGVRPIGIGCMLRTALTRAVFGADVRSALGERMAPHQVAVGVKAGMTKAIFGVRVHLEEDSAGAAIFTDLANAFNTVERGAIVAALAASDNPPRVRALARLAVTVLTPASPSLGWGEDARLRPTHACRAYSWGRSRACVRGTVWTRRAADAHLARRHDGCARPCAARRVPGCYGRCCCASCA